MTDSVLSPTVAAADWDATPFDPAQLPRHVAIIMDGNGRWATQRGLPRIEGHRQGVAAVRRIAEEAARLGLDQVTLYCFSSENWKRPEPELRFLMALLEQYMVEERKLLLDQSIRLKVIGRREGIPESALREIDRTVEMTARGTGLTLCLAINYGGRQEIVEAVRTLMADAAEGRSDPAALTEDVLASRLDTAGMRDPDLLIRTSGEMRLSNFLLWQLSYAELWVTPVCWPDFDRSHLHHALQVYASRERRFGGLAAPSPPPLSATSPPTTPTPMPRPPQPGDRTSPATEASDLS